MLKSTPKKILRLGGIVIIGLLLGRLVQIGILQYHVATKVRDSVAARQHSPAIFRLADHYASIGAIGPAEYFYDLGLQGNSRNMPYQLKLASIFLMTGRPDDAIERAQAVLEVSEDSKIKAAAENILKKVARKTFEPPLLEKPQNVSDDVHILLVPFDGTSRALLESLVPRLEEAMRCRFLIANKTPPLGRPERNIGGQTIDFYLQKLSSLVSVEQNIEIMSRGGLSEKDLKTDEGKERFVRVALERRDIFKAMSSEQFNDMVSAARQADQYDCDRLIKNMEQSKYLPKESRIKGYVGITEKDIFAMSYSYLFATCRGRYAVFSYARLKDGGGMESDVFSDRIYKQAVTSAFFSLGIPRCSSFYCVRAFTDGLTDFELKGKTLCRSCQAKLYHYLKQSAKS